MKKKEYLIITGLTIAALVISYFATYSSYCGQEGCASGGGFPFPLFTPGSAGFGTDLSIIGILANSIFYFTIFYILFRLKNKRSNQKNTYPNAK